MTIKSMRYHRLRLYLINNRVLVLYCIVLFGWTFSIILGLIVVGRIQELAGKLEDGQRGNTCILLIQPKDRTKENVTSCVNNNRRKNSSKNSPFQFNDSNSSNKNSKPISSTSSFIQPATSPHIATIQKPSPKPSEPKPSTSQSTPPVVSQPERTIETRINSLGQQECRLQGDIGWVLGDCK